ncbi:helix-turn-helix transcriptional regulator [Streptomyces sp. NPDC050848]|uniref:helix-turn-helix domain-containing protein n=1 Tax=Streptomyces sp. NPDC050848 TaxID=3155791 RepID=UPI0033E65785
MTGSDQDAAPCSRPGCTNTLSQKPTGRRRQYCSDECGRRYRKYRKYRQTVPKPVDNDRYAVEIVESIQQRTRMTASLVHAGDQPLEAIKAARAIISEWEDLEAALVQQAYDRKLKPAQMRQALSMSQDSLNRKRKDNARRRSNRAQAAQRSDPVTPPARVVRIPTPRHPEPAPTPQPAAEGGSPDHRALPTTTAGATLSKALSQLQRETGLTFTALGDAAGVSRSYISRVLTGERTPSWKVTRRMAEACGADPDELRPLWDAARGYKVAQPSSLHAALRGMHLAAGHIDTEELCARTGNALTGEEVTGLLHGTRTADWPTVSALVTALRGQPDTIRPLWQAATTPTSPGNRWGVTVSSMSAGAMG